MKITRTSRISAETNGMEIDVTEEQLALWESGMLIQEPMYHLMFFNCNNLIGDYYDI